MPRYSGRKPLQQEIFSRHVGEIRNLLHALELKDTFDEDDNRPRLDVYETAGEIVIEIDLPGADTESMSLKICGSMLVLEACKPREQNEGTFICVERSHGRFHHALHLPVTIEAAAVTAEYSRGVLRVVCPKAKERMVPIKEIRN